MPKKILKVFLLFIGIIPPFYCVAQEMDKRDTQSLSTEIIYLHIDKSFYTTGEDIWFKAYLLNAKTYEPSALSEVVYVELIGPQGTVLKQRSINTTKGSGAGNFKLSPEWQGGCYILRAYTTYMRNFGNSSFYKKTILVNDNDSIMFETDTKKQLAAANTFDVQFFPEGGYLVNGFLNPVGFKALDNHGNTIPISGKLIDDTGYTIKEFTSEHLGMGLFHFIPKPDRTYSALVSYANQEKQFTLPMALNSGILMTVSNQPMHYKVDLRGTSDLKIKDYRLIGTQNKGPVFNLIVNANKQEHTTIIKIAKDLLTEGVLELTLLNQEKRPIAERLLFHENSANSSPLSFKTNKTEYANRKLVEMEIAIDESLSKTAVADLSLSVTHTAVNPSPINTMDIRTHLLLNSVLRGEIEQPGYYFYSDNTNRQKHLDILMRTQGWRQYALESDIATSENYFLPEKGVTLSGKVVSAFDGNEALVGTVKMTYDNSKETILDEVETNPDGRFVFETLPFSDTTSVLLSAQVNYAIKKRKPTNNYKIVLDSMVAPKVHLKKQKKGVSYFTQAKEEAKRRSIDFLNMDKTIQLDEAFIAAKKQPKALDKFKLKRRAVLYTEPSQTLDFATLEVPMDEPLRSLEGRIPGLSVRNSKIYLRGAGSFGKDTAALVLVDGIPFSSADLLLTSEIDFVDIVKGPRAAIYGARAANGVISIFTKNGTESNGGSDKGVGSINFKHPGFDYARNFYRPSFTKTDAKSKRADKSTTLFWQPYIQLTDKGPARISFYAGDVSGAYQASIEGVTQNGQVLTSKVYFEIINDIEYP
jgi:hypothetical protein